MSKKRPFQVLDEMNHEDIENNSQLVSISIGVLEAKTIPEGGKVTIGTSKEAILGLVSGEYKAFLVVMNNAEYQRRIKEE